VSKLGEEVVKAMEEAVAHARGEATDAVVHHVRVATPDVRAIRRKLGLSQVEFAQRFGFSVGNIRNWEQGIRRPEGPARVLLTVIDRDPEAVRRALSAA
jgi:putative transcriptional regulator